MLSIYSNTSSLTAQRNLSQTQKALAANVARLSSGMRINSAADDAAGLGISEKLKAQIRSMGQAERNANDGISLVQTAEGAMNETSGILIRMRELAMQAATDTVGTTEKGFLQTEFSALRSEIDRIANVTKFNGTSLLSAAGTITFQVGTGTTSDDKITVSTVDMNVATFGASATNLSTLDISTASGASAALTAIDTAVSDLSSARSTFGAAENRLQTTVTNLQSARENLSAANSRIRDVDVAEESAAMARHNILAQAGVSVLAQANQMPSLALALLK